VPGGAAVRRAGQRAGRGGCAHGAVSGAGLEQRHVLRPGLRDVGALRHHDSEGMQREEDI
jgi:hypothetical protein